MTCPLCDLVKGDFKTKKYFEDDTLLVVDCSKHLVPMVVLKAHEMNPDEADLIHMEQISKRTGDQVYGEGKYRVRKEQRSSKDHLHWHIEPLSENYEGHNSYPEPEEGTYLYLVHPHGKLWYDGKKSVTVKTVKFESNIGVPIYLVDDSLLYGVTKLKEPKELTLEDFERLREKHCISEEEREKWAKEYQGWEKGPLYGYEMEDVHRFPVPLPVEVPQGVQNWGKNLQIKDKKSLSLRELEHLHALAHSYAELFSPYCALHYYVSMEMLDRGYPHSGDSACDRVVELIRNWRNYDPQKLIETERGKKVVGDDLRIVHGWLEHVEGGKKLESPQWIDLTLEEQKKALKDLHNKILEALQKIGWAKEHEKMSLPKGFTWEDVDASYVNKLSDEDLLKLYRELHEEFQKRGEVTETYSNANIFICIELLKRGLYSENKIDDKLTKETDLEIVEYPTPEGFASDSLDRDLTIEELYELAPPYIVVPGQPYAIYFTGRASNEGVLPRGHDWDWVFRQAPDRRVVEAVRRIQPPELADKIHVVFDESGPLIGHSYTGYRYGFFKVPKNEFMKGFGPYRQISETQNLSSIKPGDRFRLLKQSAGWGKNEFFDFDSFYKTWAVKHLDEGIWASKKYDGRAFSIHSDGKKVWIITEDKMRDRADQFPNVVKEVLSLKTSLIVHAECVAYDCGGKEVKNAKAKEMGCEEYPREDTAVLTVGKVSPEWEKSLVFHCHDLMYLDGQDITNLPYRERFEKLTKLLPETLQFLRVVEHSPELKTPRALQSWVQKLRKLKGSEGVYFRAGNALYPIRQKENRSPLLSKIKNLKSIDVMVWEAIPKKGVKNQWEYESVFLLPESEVKNWRESDVVNYEGHNYARIGKTFSTAVSCKRGDIIEVLVGRIRIYEREGRTLASWMFPKFREKRTDKSSPDSLDTIRKLARVGPGFIERLSDKVVLNLRICEFAEDPSVCPLKLRFGRPRYWELSDVEVEYLRFPIACPIAYLRRCQYTKSVNGDRPLVVIASDPDIMTFEEFWDSLDIQSIKDEEDEIKDLRDLNIRTIDAEGNPTKILAIMRHPSVGKILKINQKWGETVVSPMHSLIRKDGLIGNPGDELLAVRKVEFPEKEKVVLEIPDSVSRLGISFRERKRYGKRKICSHTVFEYCTRCSPWWLKNTFEGEDLKALLRVMASYITEGSVTPHSGIYYTNITQKERGYLDDVANAMKQIGDIPLTIYRNGNLWVLESNHSLLAKTLLKYSGRYSKGKKIPSFVFSLPREYREFFWNELLKGDGTKRKKWNSYYTVSKKLAAGVSLLLSTLGIDYNFNISDSFGKYSSKGYMIQEISFHSPRCKVKVQEAEPTPYLYDLQTETGSFTDGIGLVGLHNSYYYGKRTWKRIPLRRKE